MSFKSTSCSTNNILWIIDRPRIQTWKKMIEIINLAALCKRCSCWLLLYSFGRLTKAIGLSLTHRQLEKLERKRSLLGNSDVDQTFLYCTSHKNFGGQKSWNFWSAHPFFVFKLPKCLIVWTFFKKLVCLYQPGSEEKEKKNSGMPIDETELPDRIFHYCLPSPCCSETSVNGFGTSKNAIWTVG